VSSYDPSKDTTGEFGQSTKDAWTAQLAKYISAQTDQNAVLGKQKEIDDLQKSYDAKDYKTAAFNQAYNDPRFKTVKAMYSDADYRKYVQTVADQIESNMRSADNGQLQTLKSGLDPLQSQALNSFVMPSQVDSIYRTQLNGQLGTIADNAVNSANADIYSQAWQAKHGVSENLNQQGMLRSGARTAVNNKVGDQALNSSLAANEIAQGDKASQLAAFDTTTNANATTRTNLENSIKNQGYQSLADQSTGTAIQNYLNSTSQAAQTSLNNAKSTLEEQLKNNNFMSDITGLVGSGIGTALGTGLSPNSKYTYGSAS
jgi:hypothetical protein